MPDGSAGGDFYTFPSLLIERIVPLAKEWSGTTDEDFVPNYPRGQSHFVMPIALLMVLDEANGGDVTAQELVRRFDLLHRESGNVIDFYFMGWDWISDGDRTKGIRFNVDKFENCRKSLKRIGVTAFGGNADLILVDAHHWYTPGISPIDVDAPRNMGPYGVTLDFSEAIHINLASRREDLPPLGELLQNIIDTAELVRLAATEDDPRVTFRISDRLGIATAKRSFLSFILEKFGAVIGANKLEALAVRNIGPVVGLHELGFDGLRQDGNARSS